MGDSEMNHLWAGVIPSIDDFMKNYRGRGVLKVIQKLSPGIARIFEMQFGKDGLEDPSLLDRAIHYARRNAELNGRHKRPDLIDLYFGFITCRNSKI